MKRIGWALLIGLMLSLPVQAASFDCTKASTQVEKLICVDAELSKLDEELNATYKAALQDKEQAETIKQAQKQWLKERNACADVACVWKAYQQRLGVFLQRYILAMSKDAKLCNAMLDLYNEDMKTYGRIRYDQHEVFSAIKWQDDNELELQHAFFDINNDGTNELVIKNLGRLRGYNIDRLLIYPADSDVFSKLKPGPGGLRGLLDTPNQLFSFNNNLYLLKDLPNATGSISVFFVLRPFIWEKVSYISMTDLGINNEFIAAPLPRWIAIAKYKQAEELQDICYFLNPSIER